MAEKARCRDFHMWQCTPSAPRSKNVGLDFILGSVCSGFDVPGSVCCVHVLPTGVWIVVVIETNICTDDAVH